MTQNPQRPLAWFLLSDCRHRVDRDVARNTDHLNAEAVERQRRSTERAWWLST